jgi:predicted DsbA family dithiol-disulfide isomerase
MRGLIINYKHEFAVYINSELSAIDASFEAAESSRKKYLQKKYQQTAELTQEDKQYIDRRGWPKELTTFKKSY